MFENIINFFKKFGKNEKEKSKSTAKERLHLVLAQDRAHISADFLEMMKQEIIEVIKKYVDIDEGAIDVRMTNKPGEDGIVGAPALYANIPIVTIKNEARKLEGSINKNNEEDTCKDKKGQADEKLNEKDTENAENTEVETINDASDQESEEIVDEQKEDKNKDEKENEITENKQDEQVEENKEQEPEDAKKNKKENKEHKNPNVKDTKKENVKEEVNEKKNP